MKRLLFSLVTGAALTASAAAQDTTAPRQERPADRQERREDTQDRRDDRPATQQDRQENRREVQQDRRDTPPATQQDRRDVQPDRQNERREDRPAVQQERRDVQTQDRRDDRPAVQQERRDTQVQERRDGDRRELAGRVVRTGEGQFVVQTRDNRQVTVYTNPQTRYLSNNRAAQFSDLRVGSNVNFGYALEGERYIANNVTLVPATTTTTTEQVEQVPATPAPAAGTAVEGQIVRVVGQDQVVIRTADGREVIVFVSPQTTYQLGPQPAAFTDLRPGTPIGVQYDNRDNRFQARRFFTPARRNNR